MRSRLLFGAALAGALFVFGCGGPKPAASVSDVDPHFIATGRTKTVTIHGDNTGWKSSLSVDDVDFGEGITVESVTVASKTALVVEITSAANAPVGVRDVTVKGKTINGYFEVRSPIELLGGSGLVAGSYALLFVQGNDTDWVPGFTVPAFGGGDGIYVDPAEQIDPVSLLFGIDVVGVTVASRDLATVIAYVDPFASGASRTLTMAGAEHTDTVAIPLTSSTTPLAAGSTPVTLGRRFESPSFSIPGVGPGDVTITASSAGTAEPFGLVIDADLGYPDGIVGFVYDSPEVLGAADAQRQYGFLAGKSYQVSFFDMYWVLDLYLGVPAFGGDDSTFTIQVASGAPPALTSGTPLTGEQVGAIGSTSYAFTPANKWSVITVDLTNANAGLDAVLMGVRHRDTANTPGFRIGDSGYEGDPESIAFVAGHTAQTFVTVADYYGSTGASTTYDLELTSTLPLGTMVESADTNVPIGMNDPTYSGTVMAATGFTSINPSGISVALDVEHDYRGDIYATLTSPMGTEVVLIFDSFDPDPDLVEVFSEATPRTVFPDGSLSDFDGENPDGTWTLYLEDTFPALDDGVIRGWAVFIDGT